MGMIIGTPPNALLQGFSAEHLIAPAKAFVNHLSEKNVTVLLPSIVVSEYLIGVSEENRTAALQVFQTNFQILPFDGRAAHETARVFTHWSGSDMHREIKQDELSTRKQLHADCKIVGTLLSHGIDRIYSNDTSTLHKIAEGFVEAVEMPIIDEQLELEMPDRVEEYPVAPNPQDRTGL